MNNNDMVNIALNFIEMVNRRNFKDIITLMTENFVAIDEKGNNTVGKEKCVKMIESYTIENPAFQIYISDIYADGKTVSIIGRATGSCANKDRADEIRQRLIYQIETDENIARSFRYAVLDTNENRKKLGLDDAIKVTS